MATPGGTKINPKTSSERKKRPATGSPVKSLEKSKAIKTSANSGEGPSSSKAKVSKVSKVSKTKIDDDNGVDDMLKKVRDGVMTFDDVPSVDPAILNSVLGKWIKKETAIQKSDKSEESEESEEVPSEKDKRDTESHELIDLIMADDMDKFWDIVTKCTPARAKEATLLTGDIAHIKEIPASIMTVDDITGMLTRNLLPMSETMSIILDKWNYAGRHTGEYVVLISKWAINGLIPYDLLKEAYESMIPQHVMTALRNENVVKNFIKLFTKEKSHGGAKSVMRAFLVYIQTIRGNVQVMLDYGVYKGGVTKINNCNLGAECVELFASVFTAQTPELLTRASEDDETDDNDS